MSTPNFPIAKSIQSIEYLMITPTMWAPPVTNWSMFPINYSYRCHKPQLLKPIWLSSISYKSHEIPIFAGKVTIFLWVSLWFPFWFPMVSYGFPMVFLVFLWVSYVVSLSQALASASWRPIACPLVQSWGRGSTDMQII